MRYWLGKIRGWIYDQGYRPAPSNFLFYSPSRALIESVKDSMNVQFFERLNHEPLDIIENEPPYKARHRNLLKKEGL